MALFTFSVKSMIWCFYMWVMITLDKVPDLQLVTSFDLSKISYICHHFVYHSNRFNGTDVHNGPSGSREINDTHYQYIWNTVRSTCAAQSVLTYLEQNGILVGPIVTNQQKLQQITCNSLNPPKLSFTQY